ncbi:uncharacterized protein DNG_04030 [Cephalotrichum gorgonifer]|uniref:Rhodopsin domain-containing protein n=1 Tax=Cephalotrichum gorgonifer TaxID=2041049 RepID=A0AAE8MXN5_9PEZI|nr:uncharacterized protein DNG_04030 [Cephalotrichum gorgonifer]
MNVLEIILQVREGLEARRGEVGGAATYGVRAVLGLTFLVVLWAEYRGRSVVAKGPWSTWTLLISGAILLVVSILNARSISLGYGGPLHSVPAASLPSLTTLSRLADVLAFLSTISTKLFLSSVLHPSAGSAFRKLLQVGALILSLSFLPIVALATLPVEGIYCETDGVRNGCFAAETWLALSEIVAGFSTFMDLALVFIALKMTLRRGPFDPRERPTEALAIACGAGAFIAGIIKLTKFAPLETGDFTYYGPSLLLWSVTEASLTILSASTIAPYTARERIKRPRSPPTDDSSDFMDRRAFGALGCEERGDVGRRDENEVLLRSMVRAGLL